MRYAPGSLLKRQTSGASTLLPTPQSRRLTEHLHDLITITYERFINRPSNSLHLIRLEYVSGENHDGKYSMRFVGLVKDPDRLESVRINLNITAKIEDMSCSEN